MLRSSRYVTSTVLAIALLVSAGHAHGGPFFRPVSIRPIPIRPTPVNPSPIKPPPFKPSPFKPSPFKPSPFKPSPFKPSPFKPSPFKSFDAPLDPRIGQYVFRFDPISKNFTNCCDSGVVRRPLPVYGGPTSPAGRGLLASLMASGLHVDRQDPAFDLAMREARSRLVELLRSAASKDDRFELRYRYREAHRLMFDEPLSIGTLGYELIRKDTVTVSTDSPVHVYGQPAPGENRFTRHQLLLSAETELYVIDTSGLWALVAHPPSGKLGAFVGWIRMGGTTRIPGGPSSAVVAIVLEHRYTR